MPKSGSKESCVVLWFNYKCVFKTTEVPASVSNCSVPEPREPNDFVCLSPL